MAIQSTATTMLLLALAVWSLPLRAQVTPEPVNVSLPPPVTPDPGVTPPAPAPTPAPTRAPVTTPAPTAAPAINDTTNGGALAFLLSTSYALANGSAVFCPALTEGFCNATTSCFWNTNVSVCAVRGRYASGLPNATAPPGDAWCRNFFSTPFISIVYFFGAFAFGFASIGLVYNALHFNVYTTVTETGERVFNTNFYKTSMTNIYCALVVLSAGVMAILSYIHFLDPTWCSYVVATIVFLLVLVLPAVALPSRHLILAAIHYLTAPPEVEFIMDDVILPTTQAAAADPRTCKLRCF